MILAKYGFLLDASVMLALGYWFAFKWRSWMSEKIARGEASEEKLRLQPWMRGIGIACLIAGVVRIALKI